MPEHEFSLLEQYCREVARSKSDIVRELVRSLMASKPRQMALDERMLIEKDLMVVNTSSSS
jgi:hypothetical protein